MSLYHFNRHSDFLQLMSIALKNEFSISIQYWILYYINMLISPNSWQLNKMNEFPLYSIVELYRILF
jgi:hypothetical protein